MSKACAPACRSSGRPTRNMPISRNPEARADCPVLHSTVQDYWLFNWLHQKEAQVKRIMALLVLVFSFSAIAARAADASKINGWISDSMCGAKHAGSDADCVKGCIKRGM